MTQRCSGAVCDGENRYIWNSCSIHPTWPRSCLVHKQYRVKLIILQTVCTLVGGTWFYVSFVQSGTRKTMESGSLILWFNRVQDMQHADQLTKRNL